MGLSDGRKSLKIVAVTKGQRQKKTTVGRSRFTTQVKQSAYCMQMPKQCPGITRC